MAWDKGEFGKSGGVEHEVKTFEQCAQACANDDNCLQYVHDGQKCYVGLTARLGKEKKPQDGKTWRSGWNETRINSWASQQPPCNDLKFPEQKIVG